jgi:hypothetical protein
MRAWTSTAPGDDQAVLTLALRSCTPRQPKVTSNSALCLTAPSTTYSPSCRVISVRMRPFAYPPGATAVYALNPPAPNKVGFIAFTQHLLPTLSFPHGVALAAIGVALVGLMERTGGNMGPGQLVARGLVFGVVDLNTLILNRHSTAITHAHVDYIDDIRLNTTMVPSVITLPRIL